MRYRMRSLRERVQFGAELLEVYNYQTFVGAVVSVGMAQAWGIGCRETCSALEWRSKASFYWQQLQGGDLDSVWITFHSEPGLVFLSPTVWRANKAKLETDHEA